MRRAILATAGTVVGLIALLDYRSSSTVGRSDVRVGGGPLVTVAGQPGPTSASPTSVSPTTASPTTASPGGPGGPGGPAAPTSEGPGSANAAPSTTPPTSAAASGRYTGQDVVYRYGDIEVQITIADGKITGITIPEESASDPRSQSINSQAIPILTSEALAAQNLNFDVVSGATFTSDAFAQSLQTALNQAGR